ncbi:MAG TPA: hypothetical protein VGI70_14720 [Polyangiales bacterium]
MTPTVPVKSPPKSSAAAADAGAPLATKPQTPPASDAPASDASIADASLSDASLPDAATPPDALRAELITLLGAAEFSRNPRSILALLTLLVADSTTASDVDQILSPLKTDGQCETFGAALCIEACELLTQRCVVCTGDTTCKADLRSVCGASATTCP